MKELQDHDEYANDDSVLFMVEGSEPSDEADVVIYASDAAADMKLAKSVGYIAIDVVRGVPELQCGPREHGAGEGDADVDPLCTGDEGDNFSITAGEKDSK